MDRLYRCIEILKQTPHRQPELVKEATHRLLNRSIRYDNKIDYYLKHIIVILLDYCNNDDGVQRSLFNDYLNMVIQAFQEHRYQVILHALIDEVTNNGNARTVTAALLRIPQLIRNVKPIDLDCDTQKLLKSLIEVARREEESVHKALDASLIQIMPYLDHPIRSNKETHFLANILVEILLKNLSSSTRRSAVSCLNTISKCSSSQNQIIVSKLKEQLDNISKQDDDESQFDVNKFIGLCLAVREVPQFTENFHDDILRIISEQIYTHADDTNVVVAALEAARETLLKFDINEESINYDFVELLFEKFLLQQDEKKQFLIRQDTKVIIQANALSFINAIVQRLPNILQARTTIINLDVDTETKESSMDLSGKLLIMKNHPDVAVRNQVYYLIGNYINTCWRSPCCMGYSLSCDRVRELWSEFRVAIEDETTHPNVLKSCLTSMSACINTILNSDHCLHVITHTDVEQLIELYTRSNFKPLKVEVLNLFAKLDYLTLNYLTNYHWSRHRCERPSAFVTNLQDRILQEVIIASLTDESQIIKQAASAALLSVVPNLYFSSDCQRSCDPIVSLASHLSDRHLGVVEQINSQMNSAGDDISTTNLRPNEEMIIRSSNKILSSSILSEERNQTDEPYLQNKRNISTNLAKVVNLLRVNLENSLDRGKSAVLSIVRTFLKLSKAYPVHQYPSSWDCRPSEHCECYIFINFLLTQLENLTEPDIIIEDLDAYQTFLALCSNLLYALCYESVFHEYENQRMMPYYKRLISARDTGWTDLVIKHPPIAAILQIYFTHLVKLLWLISYVLAEKSNPFAMITKNQQQNEMKREDDSLSKNHSILLSNRLLFGKIHKKLESSYKSSKKNLDKQDEKFQQIVEICLASISNLFEFISTQQSKVFVKDILSCLKTISTISKVSALKCARQLLKSLFGINIIALYQIDPLDWFEEESSSAHQTTELTMMSSSHEIQDPYLQGVYHHLVSKPYKIFSNYLSNNCSQITQESDKALAALDFESRRALKVRYRIEEIIKSLFEFHPNHLVSPRIREVSEYLKNIIAEFTPVVLECMSSFSQGGFCHYQAEVLHFMSYLVLLRVNYLKLPRGNEFITAIYKLLDDCAERKFIARQDDVELILRNSFTFLILLTYQRGPNQPLFPIASVIQKLDDLRATLSLNSTGGDMNKYVVPLLRCLVEDLFIYRTQQVQNTFLPKEESSSPNGDLVVVDRPNQIACQDPLEAEKETVAHKVLTVIDHPSAYDLLSILILESRLNPDGTNYEKLSHRIFDILPEMFVRHKLELDNHQRLELTKRIFENISAEVFKPVSFIMRTLFDTPSPSKNASARDFSRWMSLVIVDLHILTTQIKEEKFLTRISDSMSVKSFIQYLLQIIQLCASEIYLSQTKAQVDPFLAQQLAHYLYYITYMFQSGLFFELTKLAPEIIKTKRQREIKMPESVLEMCHEARDSSSEFSISTCESIFYYLRYCHPDLTMMWCNLMLLLNQVDCNNDFWCNLLIYDCHHCQGCMFVRPQIKEHKVESNPPKVDNQSAPVKRPGTLNLLMGDGMTSTPCARPELPQLNSDGSGAGAGGAGSGGSSGSSVNFKRSGRSVNRPSSLNLLDISFNDQLRRSFIKRIAASESRPRAYDRNAADTCVDDSPSLLCDGVDASIAGQCLAPNVELSRRGALCLVLDFVSISMDDVEHITWLIIHHINDIIRWSHEMPIAEFINAVHGNSASSGIFIQAIDTNTNDFTSSSFVTRLLWTLEKVHYTQYGSLVVLLVEKLLSSPELMAYRSLTKKVEDFACEAVKKLLNDTNKSLVTTKEETNNQLTPEDLDKIISMLDKDLYPSLTELLFELRNSEQHPVAETEVAATAAAAVAASHTIA